MKNIERTTIRKRNSLIRAGRVMFKNALKEQYQQALQAIEHATLATMEQVIIEAINPEPIYRIFGKYYSGAASIAMDWRKYHLKDQKKADDESLYYSSFQRALSKYAREKAGNRINEITKTTEDYITGVVRDAVKTGFDEGLGIEKVRDLIRQGVADNFKLISPARANLIAQTEMITASNQAAMEGTKSLGLEFRKYWSTSGIGNSRASHIEAEADSIAVGGYLEDEAFSNGLQFPGDPTGDASEVCNCHCTLLTEII